MKCKNPKCNNLTKKQHHQYCSRSCHMSVRNESTKTGKVSVCESCGRDMYVSDWESLTKKYCSRSCKDNASLVQRIPVTCSLEGCSTVVYRTEKQIQKTEKHYCTAKCASVAGRLVAQEKGKKTNTKPELHFKQWCEDNSVQYIHQFDVPWQKGWKKWYDFYLPEYRLLVEIDGVYWHGKGLSDDQLNEQQQVTRKNDIEKNKLAVLRGYNLLRIWEDELSDLKTEKIKML